MAWTSPTYRIALDLCFDILRVCGEKAVGGCMSTAIHLADLHQVSLFFRRVPVHL